MSQPTPLDPKRLQTAKIIIAGFWGHAILIGYFVGWNQPVREPSPSISLFMFIGLASAIGGVVVMLRALKHGSGPPLSLGRFQTQLLISMALLEFPAMVAILIIGSIRHDAAAQLLYGIALVGLPVVGFGGLSLYVRSHEGLS